MSFWVCEIFSQRRKKKESWKQSSPSVHLERIHPCCFSSITSRAAQLRFHLNICFTVLSAGVNNVHKLSSLICWSVAKGCPEKRDAVKTKIFAQNESSSYFSFWRLVCLAERGSHTDSFCWLICLKLPEWPQTSCSWRDLNTEDAAACLFHTASNRHFQIQENTAIMNTLQIIFWWFLDNRTKQHLKAHIFKYPFSLKYIYIFLFVCLSVIKTNKRSATPRWK